MKDALEGLTRQAVSVKGGAPGAEAEASAEQDSFAVEAPIKPVWKFKVEDEIRSSPVIFKDVVYIGTYDNNLYGFSTIDGKPKLKFATQEGRE